jgi:hypothetical protein
MKRNLLTIGAAALSFCFSAVSVTPCLGLPPWGGPVMQPGIAAVTCAAPTKSFPSYAALPANLSYAFGVIDLRTPPATAYNANIDTSSLWNPPGYHDPLWNAENIGNVYGITLKPSGEIYVAAHGVYGAAALQVHGRYGNLGGGANNLMAAGTIYRIDQATGAPFMFAQIPGQQTMNLDYTNTWVSGPGLGNLTYHPTHNQFYVTSLEDGKIYRVSGAGLVLNNFDPMTPDNGAAGLPPLGERIWGITHKGNALYYSTWNSHNSVAASNTIRRVNLDGSGNFIPGSDTVVLTIPFLSSTWHSIAVADLSFSLDGTTLLAGERTMSSDITSYNHQSRVHRITVASWTINSSLKTGNNTAVGGEGEAYGGVAWGQEAGLQEKVIWMTSADMAANAWGNSPGPHGVFGVRPVDFPPTGPAAFTPNAFKVPFDPAFTTSGPDNKGSGGDVEIMRTTAPCEIKVTRINCPTAPGAPYTLVLSVTNLSATQTASYLTLNPCPPATLPIGATAVQPTPAFTTFLPPLATGATTTVNLTLPTSLPVGGTKICFLATLLDVTGNSCCTERVCVDLPRCDCASLVGQSIDCDVQADGTVKYTITLTVTNMTNLSPTPYPFENVTLLPSPGQNPDINPANVSNVVLSPASIPPGGTGTVTFCYTGSPGPVYANIALHTADMSHCCAIADACFNLPDCPGSVKPDECEVTRRAPCCPVAGTNVAAATVTYTICNNGLTPKSYTWNASGVSPSMCPKVLTAASFSPASGTIGPVPAGGCATITVMVNCDGFLKGECADFEICAREVSTMPAAPVCCHGQVFRPEMSTPAVKADTSTPDLPTIAHGATVPITFMIENPEPTPLSTTLIFADNEGVLRFSRDGSAGQSTGVVPVSLAAGEKRTLILNAFVRNMNGSGLPTFTLIMVTSTNPAAPDRTPLVTPVLLRGNSEGMLAIESIQLAQAPPRVLLDVQTETGRRYKIQHSEDLIAWVDVTCDLVGASLLPDGTFLGSGGVVQCQLPCSPSAVSMFYRAVRVE